jgi:hypothetical protein
MQASKKKAKTEHKTKKKKKAWQRKKGIRKSQKDQETIIKIHTEYASYHSQITFKWKRNKTRKKRKPNSSSNLYGCKLPSTHQRLSRREN